MATPRVKRAFAGSASDPAQRHITSFFARDENAPAPGDRASRSPSHEISSPLLPPSVQANLLAVGMRVRKSVPGGYKTGKEADERTTPPHYRPQPKAPSSSSTSTSRSFLQSAGRLAAPPPPQRELLPFCGLNKIGGLGVQSYGDEDGRPMFASSLFEGIDGDAAVAAVDSEPPALTSSQGTVSSTSSYLSPPPRQASTQFGYTAKKRLLGDEEDEDEDEAEVDYDTPTHTYSCFQVHEDKHKSSRAIPTAPTTSINSWLADGQGSPRTQTPLYHLGRRVLAVPRRRQQQQRPPSLSVAQAALESPKPAEGQLPQPGSRVRVVDQENVADFDEADFLDDTEMGGM